MLFELTLMMCVQKIGTAQTSSFVYPLLERHEANEKAGVPNDFTMKDINGSAASIFIAGSSTTYTTTVVGILNLLLNPQVFAKARLELDQVIGTDRLPSLKDRENPELRYLEYVCEETIRWRPLSPIGIPHKSLKDDVYNGMFIPKGTCVYYNAYAMSRDENVYKKPESFNPDRYRPKSEGGDGEPFLEGPFGFGRRICVGRYLAQASVWIALATLISTTDISKPTGADGKPVEPVVKFTTGLSSHPTHFDCEFKPRSKKAEMVLSNWNN
jgi:cytochrome P450